LVTCAALAMLGGSIHVVMLGADRMAEMRGMSTYNVKDVSARIRAAGEDIQLHRENEHPTSKTTTYTVAEAEALLSSKQWHELDTMIAIPAGDFIIGTDRSQADDQDKPAHHVRLPGYLIDKYPVTNAQYARFVAATGHRPPLDWKNGRIPDGELLYPVTMVSWFDARSYAAWAKKRLPKEAEWEKAARGPKGMRWPWGNLMDAKRLNTYYSVGHATDVTAYPNGASPYGVMDMAGNVSQWTEDDYLPYPGSNAPQELFQGKVAIAKTQEDRAMKVVDLVPVKKRYKVLRGGSWKSDPFSTTGYHRISQWPNLASDFFGFRCAKDIPQAKN
jgi:iron(II)-dependent oxidoreductase